MPVSAGMPETVHFAPMTRRQKWYIRGNQPSSMSNQSFATHLRYVPTYHYGTFGALLVVLVWSLFKLITDFSIDRLMMLVLVVAVAFATYYARAFALRAQDRVIRLEEQMRMLRLLPDQLQ